MRANFQYFQQWGKVKKRAKMAGATGERFDILLDLFNQASDLRNQGAKFNYKELEDELGSANVAAIIELWRDKALEYLLSSSKKKKEEKEDIEDIEDIEDTDELFDNHDDGIIRTVTEINADAAMILNYLYMEQAEILKDYLLKTLNNKQFNIPYWQENLAYALGDANQHLEAGNLTKIVGKTITANRMRALRTINAYISELSRHYIGEDKDWFATRGLVYGAYVPSPAGDLCLAKNILALDKWTHEQAQKNGKKTTKKSTLANMYIVNAQTLANNYLPLLCIEDLVSLQGMSNGRAYNWLDSLIPDDFSDSPSSVTVDMVIMDFLLDTLIGECNEDERRALAMTGGKLRKGKLKRGLHQRLSKAKAMAVLHDFMASLSDEEKQVLVLEYGAEQLPEIERIEIEEHLQQQNLAKAAISKALRARFMQMVDESDNSKEK